MNRTFKAILGVIFILAIAFAAISIFHNAGSGVKADVTAQKLYTLSDGTKSILGKIGQPITVKLYYAETAAMKGPDQIKYFNNYYEFVKSLLEQYAAQSNGMVKLQVIDPRPYSDEEAEALRFGLKRFQITEDESFFFGLALQTQFGAEKTIPFFSPDRQGFLEYDISYLIDSAITRKKNVVGVLSSLPVVGDDVTGYMAQMMRMQGQQPKPAWGIIDHLKQEYEVKNIAVDTSEISGVDILFIIHPKDLKEQTQFAIDQFVVKGGRAIVCVDPHSIVDMPDQQAMMMGSAPPSQSSDLKTLFKAWGLEMPFNTFAGDRNIAATASMRQDQRPEKIIGFLELGKGCFSGESSITGNLNQVRVLFAGSLREIDDPNAYAGIKRTPLLMTTAVGNEWKVSSPYELMLMDSKRLMQNFVPGNKPVSMGYMVSGKFRSAFPNGVTIQNEQPDPNDPNGTILVAEELKGVTESNEDGAVVVFSDVDFISDILAYQDSIFGKTVVGDNSAMLLNAIDELSGSSELISIRSRGNFKRPFVRVDDIERAAEAATLEEEERINAEIAGFQSELQKILSSAKEGDQEIIGSSILEKKKELELKLRGAQRHLRDVKMARRKSIEQLGNKLRNLNMLGVPAVVMVVAVTLGARRSFRKRHYIIKSGRD